MSMIRSIIPLFLFCWWQLAHADIAVSDAWARSTVAGQEVGAVYMTLTSPVDASLVSARTPVADSVEIHRMWMENGVMKMRMMEQMPLPAGKAVKLAPEGFHLMLFDLKAPLISGKRINLELTIRDAKGKLSKQNISVPVKAD